MAKRNELKEQVEACLQKYPETRNSDITLTLKIWEEYYPQRLFASPAGRTATELQNLHDLPREDNVKRIRAKFNEQGKYYPTSWDVAKQRKIEADSWRLFMRRFGNEHAAPLPSDTLVITSSAVDVPEPEVCDHGLPKFVQCPQCVAAREPISI